MTGYDLKGVPLPDPPPSNSHAVPKSYVDRLTLCYWRYIYYNMNVNNATIVYHPDGTSVKNVICNTPSHVLRSIMTSGHDAANACLHTSQITNVKSDDYLRAKTVGSCMFASIPHFGSGIDMSIFVVGQRLSSFPSQTYQMRISNDDGNYDRYFSQLRTSQPRHVTSSAKMVILVPWLSENDQACIRENGRNADKECDDNEWTFCGHFYVWMD